MDIKNFFPAIKAILHIDAFSKGDDGNEFLTAEEKQLLLGYGFGQPFVDRVVAALKETDTEGRAADDPDDKRIALMSGLLSELTANLDAKTAEVAALKESKAADAKLLGEAETRIKTLTDKIAVLSELPDFTAGVKAPADAVDVNDTKQLMGLKGDMFALDRPYNARARAAMLAQQGVMVAAPLESSIDYRRLNDDLGAFYRTPWRDRLQSYIATLPSLEKLFPLESGHQHMDTLTSIWLGEMSQPENTVGSQFSQLVKGKFEFDTETLLMYGVQFTHLFTDMKTLERSWIGSLNREGSGAIKWSFIEYLLARVAEKLHNEREQRRVNGVRKNPTPGIPGRANEAADGLYEYIRKRIEGYIDFTPDGGHTGRTVYQIKPFELGEITPGNIGEVLYRGTSMIPAEWRDTGRIVLYMPSHMIPWYHKWLETHNGKNMDYKAGVMYVWEYPNVKIVSVPNADSHHRLIWTFDGNLKTYEQAAGEMLKFQLEQQDWTLKVWSLWKESLQAEVVGFKYESKEEMDGSRQLIWTNEYDRGMTDYIAAEPDKNPSVLLHRSVSTVRNTSEFEITDIADAKVGEVVSLRCGAAGGHGVKISVAGVFSLLSAAWQPGVGDTITLMKRADGKFIELGRATASGPALQIAPDATALDFTGSNEFVCGVNTQPTEITDIAGMTPGVVYTLYGNGKGANVTTIKKGDKFALTADISLKDGASIKLVKGNAETIHEVSRS